MARSPRRTSSLSAKAGNYARRAVDDFPKVIDFVTSPSGLNQRIFPAQRFFLKVMEKEDLDDTVADIQIRDQFNERVLYTLTEAGYYRMLRDQGRFSLDYTTYQNTPIVEIIFNMGRRASKSTMISLWASTKLGQLLVHDSPQEWFGILPTDSMNISLTALGEDNAVKLFDRLASIIKAAPYFQPFLLEPAATSSLKLWTRNDIATMRDRMSKSADAHTNSINITAQSNSPGVRGDNNIFCILEEFAHFNQSRSRQSRDEKQLDEIIYDALSPSVSGFRSPDGKPFGKILIITSPNGKQGQYFKQIEYALEKGPDSFALYLEAPTWEVNPSVAPAFLRKKYNESRTTYDQEYGAKILTGGLAWLQDLPLFHVATLRTAVLEPPHGRIDRTYYMGLDFALSRDATAFAICHVERFYANDPNEYTAEALAYLPSDVQKAILEARGTPDLDFLAGLQESDYSVPDLQAWLNPPLREAFVLDYVGVRYARKPPYEHRSTLLIDELLDEIGMLFRKWPIAGGIYDQWAGELIKQQIEKRPYGKKLTMVTFTDLGNDACYKLFSELLHDRRLVFPAVSSLTNSLLALCVEHRAHDVIRVEAPPGGHDDDFSALTRALWLCNAAHSKNFVLAGQLINLNLGPGVERTLPDFGASGPNLAAYQKLQALQGHNQLSRRNPAAQLNAAKVMAQGIRQRGR